MLDLANMIKKSTFTDYKPECASVITALNAMLVMDTLYGHQMNQV